MDPAQADHRTAIDRKIAGGPVDLERGVFKSSWDPGDLEYCSITISRISKVINITVSVVYGLPYSSALFQLEHAISKYVVRVDTC